MATLTLRPVLRLTASVRRTQRDWWSLYRQRRALADLDACLLEDIGLSKSQAARESRRAPWDAPSHWRN